MNRFENKVDSDDNLLCICKKFAFGSLCILQQLLVFCSLAFRVFNKKGDFDVRPELLVSCLVRSEGDVSKQLGTALKSVTVRGPSWPHGCQSSPLPLASEAATERQRGSAASSVSWRGGD